MKRDRAAQERAGARLLGWLSLTILVVGMVTDTISGAGVGLFTIGALLIAY